MKTFGSSDIYPGDKTNLTGMELYNHTYGTFVDSDTSYFHLPLTQKLSASRPHEINGSRDVYVIGGLVLAFPLR
jgi:hypothetical protein